MPKPISFGVHGALPRGRPRPSRPHGQLQRTLNAFRGGLIRPRHIAAFVAAFIGLGFGAVAPAAEGSVEGVWEGRYICSQGPTAVTLTIKAMPHWPGFQVYFHHWLMSLIRGPTAEPS